MSLHSLIFIFLFLPLSLLLCLPVPHKLKNPVLLGLSLFFYAWGDSRHVIVLLVSILINYGGGILIEKTAAEKPRKLFLASFVFLNISILFYYKYLEFFLYNFTCLKVAAIRNVYTAHQHLPLGISFFTFQAISYLVDIYRKKHSAEAHVIAFGLYLALFSKIIAGPITRYIDIASELVRRKVNLESFGYGVQRFITGLGKKMLIANTVGKVADQAFGLKGADLDMPTAWLGIVCYTLQIYFDFSGYSDMAIGLGRMFGFTLPENFNYPYAARSIREFWQRWHITLSSWFRGYLYIPLGGNRCSTGRTYFNLFIVFILCGLWHGASWNFVVWGLYHGVFMVVERMGLARVLERAWSPLRHLYAVLGVMIGWVLFRADNLTHALSYIKTMVSFRHDVFDYFSMTFVNRQFCVTCTLACILSAPVENALDHIRKKIEARSTEPRMYLAHIHYLAAGLLLMLAVFIASVMQLATATYSPFIYTRF